MRELRAALALLLALAPVDAAASAFAGPSVGTTTSQFLQLGAGARAAALGEAYTAVADDATALYWNPAGMTRVDARAATLMHSPYLASSYFDYGAYAQKLGDDGALGAGVQYFSAGSIPGTDANGVATGAFTPNDLALSLGYGRLLRSDKPWLDGFSAGLSAKYIRSSIVTTAQTGAADLGVLSPGYLGGRLRAAATISNLGGTMRFDREPENLPLVMKLGAGYRLTDAWLVAADLGLPRGNGAYAACGTEYQVRFDGGRVGLAGRMGYNTRTTADVHGFTGASFGLGLRVGQLDTDFAVVPFGELGETFRMSLSLRFGAAPAAQVALAPARRTAAAKAPTPPATALERADRFYEAGEMVKAKASYVEAAEALSDDDPRRAHAADRLGRLAQRGGDCEMASAYYRVAIKMQRRLNREDDALTDATAGLSECGLESKKP